ncbi:MAG: site-2 protease family protein [Sphingomonas sp.]|uniref:site-2 protease family protein n=1 Tax=Sphingomonas sp. TaxID=28214 RepID=UPI0025CCEDE3|nr:site-2 protease family protein [Sphingomonas sp.]MBX3564466.1 site-2 protease family protein [Sphingomonas sp.]
MRALAGIVFFLTAVAESFALGAYWPGDTGMVLGLMAMLALSFVAVLVHELGHAGAVWALGGRVRRIVALPLSLQLRPRKWSMIWQPRGGDLGGYVTFELNTIDRHRKHALIAFAGPAANFALSAALGLAASRLHPVSLICALTTALAIMSAGMGLANLIPFKGSDGEALIRAARLGRERRAG